MTAPAQPLAALDEQPQEPVEQALPGRSNLVPGTALARLARQMRQAGAEGPERIDLTDQEPAVEVANPYGTGLEAYEPNTVWFEDVYDEAYQSEKDRVESEAADQLVTGDFSPGGNGGNVSGVPYADAFNTAAAKYGLPASVLAGIARAESNFNPRAGSSAGAQGLMQFMPGTAAGLGVDPWNPGSAIDGAARYLKQQLDRFGSLDLALAAYNAGPGNVSKYGGIPPFAETQTYVRRVRAFMQDYGTGSPTPANFSSGGFVEATGRTSGMVQAAMGLAAKRTPYVWGGTTVNGVDCSGLIYYAARAAGITDWKRYRAVDYGRMGTSVSLSSARPGDIVYTDNVNSDTDHVGIYIGNGRMVQAPTTGDIVRVSGVGGYTSIRRIFNDGAYTAGASPSGQQAPMYNGRPFDPYTAGATAGAAGAVLGPALGGAVGTALFAGTAKPKPSTRSYDRRLIE